jgi:hypothetical protein
MILKVMFSKTGNGQIQCEILASHEKGEVITNLIIRDAQFLTNHCIRHFFNGDDAVAWANRKIGETINKIAELREKRVPEDYAVQVKAF